MDFKSLLSQLDQLNEATEKTKTDAQRNIWVTFRKEGVHLYPGADKDPALATGGWDDDWHYTDQLQVSLTGEFQLNTT